MSALREFSQYVKSQNNAGPQRSAPDLKKDMAPKAPDLKEDQTPAAPPDAPTETPSIRSIKINPQNASKVGGGYLDFSLTGAYENSQGAKLQRDLPKGIGVKWKAEPPIVDFDADGRAFIKGLGKTTITATFSGLKATTTLNVAPPCPGAQKTFVMFHVRDTNTVPIGNAKGIAVFNAYEAGAKDVVVEEEIKDGKCEFGTLFLMPDGDVVFKAIRQENGAVIPSQVITYKIKNKGRMIFNANLKAQEGKVKDTQGTEEEDTKGEKKGERDSTTKTHKDGKEEEHSKTRDKGVKIPKIPINISIGKGSNTDGTKKSTEDSKEQESETSKEHSNEKKTKRKNEREVEANVKWETAAFDLAQES